ncbi:MerR family transcriptional regulator [Exiguobacterium sp. JLM-2]|uniref:MerR family transcriptional regulator n=1 Tax=Exiguobacterium sp. JLM-2 TaxID=1647415 RepID=UPI00064AF7B3|nr:MerR family transcriptional regulator [Exiguobacterium sp. JLM-2]
MTDEFSYSSAEICELFNIKSSTLRKWALLLQEAGHRFTYDNHGKRIYHDRDVTLLHVFVAARRPGVTVQQAAKTAVEQQKRQAKKIVKDEGVTDVTDIVTRDGGDKVVTTDPAVMEVLTSLVTEVRELRAEIAELKQLENDRQLAIEHQSKPELERSENDQNAVITDDEVAEEAEQATVKRSWWERITGK